MISLVVLSSSSISLSHTQELKLSSYEKTYAHHINLMYLPTYLPILFFNTITHLSHSLYLTHVTLSLSFSFAYTNKNALFFSLQLIYSLPLSPTLSLCCTLSLSLSLAHVYDMHGSPFV